MNGYCETNRLLLVWLWDAPKCYDYSLCYLVAKLILFSSPSSLDPFGPQQTNMIELQLILLCMERRIYMDSAYTTWINKIVTRIQCKMKNILKKSRHLH